MSTRPTSVQQAMDAARDQREGYGTATAVQRVRLAQMAKRNDERAKTALENYEAAKAANDEGADQ